MAPLAADVGEHGRKLLVFQSPERGHFQLDGLAADLDRAVNAVEDDPYQPLLRAEHPLAVDQRRGEAFLSESRGLMALGADLREQDAPGFEAAKYVFTPPLREKWHQEKLWDGLKRDHLQVVSTDHCPFCFKEQKELGRDDFTKIPNGGPGVEHRMSLIYSGGVASGRFSANRFVELVSTTPAKLFGLYPRKGTIAVGSDADLVIFDPKRKHTISVKTHHMRVDYSMFEGIEVTGMPDVVLSRGKVVVEDNKFLGRAGQGEFLRRATYAQVNG